MTSPSDTERPNYEALTGAMVGGGFAYSLSMGYGVLHGLGMAVAFAVLGSLLAIAHIGFRKMRTRYNANGA